MTAHLRRLLLVLFCLRRQPWDVDTRLRPLRHLHRFRALSLSRQPTLVEATSTSTKDVATSRWLLECFLSSETNNYRGAPHSSAYGSPFMRGFFLTLP